MFRRCLIICSLDTTGMMSLGNVLVLGDWTIKLSHIQKVLITPVPYPLHQDRKGFCTCFREQTTQLQPFHISVSFSVHSSSISEKYQKQYHIPLRTKYYFMVYRRARTEGQQKSGLRIRKIYLLKTPSCTVPRVSE